MNPNLFTFVRRRNGLLIGTGLVVAYVRNFLQYHRYAFGSWWEFLGFWFLHYIAILLVGAIFYACLDGAQRFFVGEGDNKDVSLSVALVYFCVAVLIISVAVFILAHWPTSASEE